MLTKTIALINLLGLFVFGLFLPAEIRVTHATPAMINAGSEVKVTITVEKGDLSGFAKLQIDLPEGLSATAIETKGASFTFADGKAKFIWMALPSQPRFEVSYSLIADATANGTYPINGKLSYIEENERKTHDMSTATVQVVGAVAQETPAAPAPTATSEPVAEQPVPEPSITDASNDIVSAAGAVPVTATVPLPVAPPLPRMVAAQQGEGNVSAMRTITAVTETEMLVEVTISKGQLRGFGKLQETIPAGFSALERASDEAIFTTQGTIVKFVWLNLPAKSELKVSYKLRGNGQPEGDYLVNGEFGYLLNDETRKAVVGSTTFAIGPQALAAQQQQGAPQQPVADTNTQQQQAPPVVPSVEPIAQQPVKTKPSGRIPAPETGVTYKVQITAAHKEVGPEYFAERHRFMGQFNLERHEGWIKYTTGRFGAYQEARDQRQAFVSAGHGFPGPFVTAYNNGDRITVQEALMLSQQRWVP